MKRKAFTLVEIMIAVLISSIILGMLYQVFSGTLSSFMKSTNKITNLRAASMILYRLKNDVRCAVAVAANNDRPELKYIIEDKKFSFITTSNTKVAGANEGSKRVTYTWTGNELKREVEGASAKSINKALIKDFSVTQSEGSDGRKFITVKIVIDNEQKYEKRSKSSKANQIELSAVLYPRFFSESLTEEEVFWYNTKHET